MIKHAIRQRQSHWKWDYFVENAVWGPYFNYYSICVIKWSVLLTDNWQTFHCPSAGFYNSSMSTSRFAAEFMERPCWCVCVCVYVLAYWKILTDPSASEPCTLLFSQLNSATCTGGHWRPCVPGFNLSWMSLCWPRQTINHNLLERPTDKCSAEASALFWSVKSLVALFIYLLFFIYSSSNVMQYTRESWQHHTCALVPQFIWIHEVNPRETYMRPTLFILKRWDIPFWVTVYLNLKGFIVQRNNVPSFTACIYHCVHVHIRERLSLGWLVTRKLGRESTSPNLRPLISVKKKKKKKGGMASPSWK